MKYSPMKHRIMLLALTAIVAFFPGTARAGETAATTITFAILGKTTFSNTPPPKFPAELRKLEGKRVRISGFASPYDNPEKLTKMLLSNSPGGCFFCSPSSVNAVVFVRRIPADKPLKNIDDMVEVEGILHLWRAEMNKGDEAKGFLFTIDQAMVRSKKR